MTAIKDIASTFLFTKLLNFEEDEGLSTFNKAVTRFHVRVALGVLGVLLGSKVAWRWIKARQKKKKMNEDRRKKQEERRKALHKMEELIKSSKMTSVEAEAIAGLSPVQLLNEIKNKRLLATQVLTAYQFKALEVHKQTNCLVEPILEAVEWAQVLDQVSSPQSLLHGLPVSIKDCIGIKGYDATIGCSKWIDQPFSEDSVIVQVLKHQGAIPFMKTNVPQTMLSYETTNPIFGATVNPCNTKRSAGGSSGGESALIAGGGSPCGIGSDVGGSIRVPASMCGIPAFKSTALRISKKGGRTILAGKNILSSWGPLGRDVDTLILLMKAILVPHMYELDPSIPVMPFRNEVLSDKRPLRIGYFDFDGAFEAVPVMRRAVMEAKGLLETAGHQLVQWDGRQLPIVRSLELLGKCLFADGGNEVFDILKYDAVDQAVSRVKKTVSKSVFIRRLLAFFLKPFVPEMTARLLLTCGFRNVSEYWDAIKEIKDMQTAVIECWQRDQLDAIICPAFGCPALPVGHIKLLSSSVGGYVTVFNILDFPAGCLPVTTVTEKDLADMDNYPTMTSPTQTHRILKQDMKEAGGLPVSVQIVTLPWQDELCLKVMRDLEKAIVQSRSQNE